MEVAEVDAPERKEVRRLLLCNPQMNSSSSSTALVCHLATSPQSNSSPNLCILCRNRHYCH